MTDQELIEALCKRCAFFLLGSHYLLSNSPDQHCSLAADRIESLTAERDRLREALGWFLDDPRFVVTIGGNPYAVEAMLDNARAVLDSERG